MSRNLNTLLFSNSVIIFIDPNFIIRNIHTSELYIPATKSCACDSCMVINWNNCGQIHAVYHNPTQSVLFWNCQRRSVLRSREHYALYWKEPRAHVAQESNRWNICINKSVQVGQGPNIPWYSARSWTHSLWQETRVYVTNTGPLGGESTDYCSIPLKRYSDGDLRRFIHWKYR